MPSTFDSIIAIIVGLLLVILGAAGGGTYIGGAFAGISSFIYGITIILGAIAYRSAKNRYFGKAKTTLARVTILELIPVLACTSFVAWLFQTKSLEDLVDPNRRYVIVVICLVMVPYLLIAFRKPKFRWKSVYEIGDSELLFVKLNNDSDSAQPIEDLFSGLYQPDPSEVRGLDAAKPQLIEEREPKLSESYAPTIMSRSDNNTTRWIRLRELSVTADMIKNDRTSAIPYIDTAWLLETQKTLGDFGADFRFSGFVDFYSIEYLNKKWEASSIDQMGVIILQFVAELLKDQQPTI